MRSHVRSVGATGDRSERFTFALNFPGALTKSGWGGSRKSPSMVVR